MTKQDILNLDGAIINDEIFAAIEESEEVTGMENCGRSGQDIRYNLWVITLADGTEIEILA